MTGLETSELLVSKGNKVTVVEMADKIAPGAWFQQLDDALPVLEKAGTEFLTSHKLLSVSSSGIELENLKEKKAVAIKVDLVVLSLGVRSDNSLYNDIKTRILIKSIILATVTKSVGLQTQQSLHISW